MCCLVPGVLGAACSCTYVISIDDEVARRIYRQYHIVIIELVLIRFERGCILYGLLHVRVLADK